MNKKIVSVCLCFLLISMFIVSCKRSGESKLDPGTQNITSLSALKTPDEIVYYHNGQKKAFSKDSPKFDNIIALNIKRNQGKINEASSIMEVGNVSNSEMLIYNYDKIKYASIYFPLNKPKDARYLIGQATAFMSNSAQVYVYLSSPDELIKYLNE